MEPFQFQSAEKRQTPPPAADQSALAPNYLRHPAIGYKVDVTDIPEEDDGSRGGGERVAVNDASNHATFAGKKKPPPPPSFRILKARKYQGSRRSCELIHTTVALNLSTEFWFPGTIVVRCE